MSFLCSQNMSCWMCWLVIYLSGSVPVCVVCMCVFVVGVCARMSMGVGCVHMCMSICVSKHIEVREKHWLSCLEIIHMVYVLSFVCCRQSVSLSWNSPGMLRWPTSPRNKPVFSSPVLGYRVESSRLHFFMWVLGNRTQFVGLLYKYSLGYQPGPSYVS